jgi:hypothetical protein
VLKAIVIREHYDCLWAIGIDYNRHCQCCEARDNRYFGVCNLVLTEAVPHIAPCNFWNQIIITELLAYIKDLYAYYLTFLNKNGMI